ncbi:MAG: Gfo/Idh/MocA family oxidoreductase [Nitrososphaeria archaeon]|nr:Gfo/Idh/MocA family oxidoreductase [Nitrososphaeria archaeon]
MSNVKIGVIGVGGWGKNHVRVLNELKALEAICDVNEERVKEYSIKYQVYGYTDLDKFLEHELDGVIVSTPTKTHYEIALKSIEKGLNVMVEKPFTYEIEEGEKLVKMAKEKNVILTVGFIERFNPAMREVKKLVAEGTIGAPLYLLFTRENRWPVHIIDVGVILDTAIHDIDLSRWFFEEEPSMVFARMGAFGTKHERVAALVLGFSKERTSLIISNWITPRKVRELEIVGENGTISLNFITQEIKIDLEDKTDIPRTKYEEPLLLELKHFIECIKDGKSPEVRGEDGVKATKIAHAALASNKLGSAIFIHLEK